MSRPVNAIKEILENSLDAGATKIQVYANDLSKFTVQDNGQGILKGKRSLSVRLVDSGAHPRVFLEDFALLCKRHTT